MPMLMVFADPTNRARVAVLAEETGGRVLEWYEAYALAEVPDDAARQRLEDRFLVQDLTALYEVQAHPDDADTAPLPSGPHHYLVQFIGPVKPEWLAGVVDAGGQPRATHGHFTHVIRADEAAVDRIAGLDYVRWLGHLPYTDRISRSARDSAAAPPGAIRAPELQGVYTVEFFHRHELDAARHAVERLGFEVLATEPGIGVMVVRTDAADQRSRLEELAEVHGVMEVRPRFLGETANNRAIRWMGVARATGDPQLGLDGTGQVVAVCDSGLDTGKQGPKHKDFRDRVREIIPYPVAPDARRRILDDRAASPWNGEDTVNGHGTHVAGSVLGDGAESGHLKSGPIRGLAPAATLVFQAVGKEVVWEPGMSPESLSGLPLNLGCIFDDAYRLGARIHCNAWARGDDGIYDEQSRTLDQFVWEHRDFCVVVAAGNANPQAESESVLPPGTAKNCITVGMTGSDRRIGKRRWGRGPNKVELQSRRGQAKKNRHKPDVVAPGVRILSARSSELDKLDPKQLEELGAHPYHRSSKYFFLTGTSQATALTAGMVALLRQHLVQHEGFASPSAALLKAALIAGATRLRPRGRDWAVVDDSQGYGRVNLDAVVRPDDGRVCFEDEEALRPGLVDGQVVSRSVNVRSSDVPFRVVLAYTDREGPALVNNLNLLLHPPSGSGRRRGKRTDPLLGNQAQRKPGVVLDSHNNVEVIEVQRPQPGRWRIEVIGAWVRQEPQPFALVYRCDM